LKIAILGGTFNPIHNGHLLIAELVKDEYNLDVVYFIPANIPPHKDFKPIISDNHRIKLIELAIESNPHFKISDIEIKRGGISYTIDTINYFYSNFDIENRIFLIIGGDLIKDIYTWKEYDKLLSIVDIVVVNRGNNDVENNLKEFPFIKTISSIKFSVSSTLVRDRISKDLSIKYLVPDRVEEYIKTNKLYK